MPKLSDRTVLLFYKDYESDKWVRGDRHLKRLVRPLYDRLHHGQKVTGFLVWYQLLVKALRRQGVDVRCNDYSAARRNPEHPVGLVGYPHLMDGWKLPNPAVLGPGLYDHPSLAPALMDDPRYRYYLVTCDWMRRLFEPAYGDRCVLWYAGIDLDEWADTRGHAKDIDVLVYDKVRWERPERERDLLNPVMESLARRGLRTEVLRYKHYDHGIYRKTLARSRSMLFLCEHETQGMAYQEAMACNVPVLAWDPGFWRDPQRLRYGAEPVETTSVPYFSEECGERFRGWDDFDDAMDRFWARLGEYTPRAFVGRELPMEGSAARYLSYYSRSVAAPAR